MSKVLELARKCGAGEPESLFGRTDYVVLTKYELERFYALARADYETKLSAVMPADFKDWHENNRNEWPEVAAWVITNLREQRADLEAENAKLREALKHVIDDMGFGRDVFDTEAVTKARAALGENDAD